ncbi:3,4-dihydroxy-2-butanone-4-phosphate synthase [Paracidovorax avenae]|uniref:3,4-dihydroxy-2-butanone-4-phosphate synthase n=1 Tax=Paracidovorax avenae TaxID=80867 RepID=UPI000D2154DD|nr:3,4-dihydroxy-2-butanone-4-phosphate synthase [Paracidovorax avenae]AVT12850.1 3,4-dihydroxy-2-butanone-4-phosphate synthase [Paracidovorax avenae]
MNFPVTSPAAPCDAAASAPGPAGGGVPLASMADVLAQIAAGRPVLVLDDADRENEADLVCAAENMAESTMALMIREGSGIVCLCLPPDHARALGLRPMVEVNRSSFATAFTQSIEAAWGVSTGVSAADRLQTVRCALRVPPAGAAPEVVSPGHVFPLVARPGGVLERGGHTESAVDLARLAGLRPAGVLCELMNPDGTMARGTDVARFAHAHGLLCTTVHSLAAYRLAIGDAR